MPNKTVSADYFTGEVEISSSENNKQHVTFGTSKIIEMTSDHSDEYFAHIQEELSKMNDIKPKKSILKTSTSYHKESGDGHHHSEAEEKE